MHVHVHVPGVCCTANRSSGNVKIVLVFILLISLNNAQNVFHFHVGPDRAVGTWQVCMHNKMFVCIINARRRCLCEAAPYSTAVNYGSNQAVLLLPTCGASPLPAYRCDDPRRCVRRRTPCRRGHTKQLLITSNQSVDRIIQSINQPVSPSIIAINQSINRI